MFIYETVSSDVEYSPEILGLPLMRDVEFEDIQPAPGKAYHRKKSEAYGHLSTMLADKLNKCTSVDQQYVIFCQLKTLKLKMQSERES